MVVYVVMFDIIFIFVEKYKYFVMLQTDYFLRIIREFMDALQFFIAKRKHGDKFMKELEDLYKSYLGPYDFYHISEMDDIMNDFKRFPENQRLDRMEMLARLYYVEASEIIGPSRRKLLERSLMLFNFIDAHSKTYSIEREMKISSLQSELHKCEEE